jgi:hypothetical protein
VKDFNDLLAKDREFKVQDQVFKWRDVRPEVLSSFEVNENGDDPNAVWTLMDRQILLFIEDEQHERWAELRAREKEPVTIGQINAVLTWLMEEQTGRPTEQPSPSAPGRGKTAASSKAAER